MALHRKMAAIDALRPDLAVISECAAPDILSGRGLDHAPGVWVGHNRNKGLGIFGFGAFDVAPLPGYKPYLRHVVPVAVSGPVALTLIGVWAQNASGGVTRKHQLGPLRRALRAYRHHLGPRTVLGGDLNNNNFWDKPGWRGNHQATVDILSDAGLVSAYHHRTGEAEGQETVPTLYWRDRREDGPRYHIDYAFLPRHWAGAITDFQIGTFADWCGPGLSDHAPLILDLDPAALPA